MPTHIIPFRKRKTSASLGTTRRRTKEPTALDDRHANTKRAGEFGFYSHRVASVSIRAIFHELRAAVTVSKSW